MPAKLLKDYLDKNQIKYVTIKHSLAYTAQEIAASAHIKGKDLVKTVLVKMNGKLAMVALPASHMLDLVKLKKELNVENIRLANEMEFKDLIPDCEVGAMPPFGSFYGMELYVSEALTRDNEIAFNACNHTELVQLVCKDYMDLVKPKITRSTFPTKL